ncbi:four-carbon acid sugar kinase family protein, partial [Escherichia coli]
TQSLGIKGFHIGPTISPGVPWVNALDKPVSLALKSGNFGDEAFFSRAQREFLS